jgi:hypothetical protein
MRGPGFFAESRRAMHLTHGRQLEEWQRKRLLMLFSKYFLIPSDLSDQTLGLFPIAVRVAVSLPSAIQLNATGISTLCSRTRGTGPVNPDKPQKSSDSCCP